MPQKRNSSEPPKVTTWTKASPVLVVAIIFDALRFIFEWFVFFGPALAAIACTAGVNSAIGTTIAGVVGKVVATVCTAGAAVVGFFGAAVTGPFGMVMATATGFAGWLVIGGWLMVSNARIFKENALSFVMSLIVSEIPFVNSIPAITIVVWRMYSKQIKTEREALAKWQREQAAEQLQEQNQQALALKQIRAAQQAEDEEFYAQEQVAEDEEYDDDEIPDEMHRAA